MRVKRVLINYLSYLMVMEQSNIKQTLLPQIPLLNLHPID